MAFDWTQVDGYKEEMTADEKLALLDNFDPKGKDAPQDEGQEPAPAAKEMKGYIPKAQYDKLSSEVASLKKQLRGKMSEQEQQELDRQAEQDAMMQELTALRREKTVSNHKASFLGQGYDEALAEEAAVAMADGDMDTVFSAMKKHQVAAEKALRAQIMKETPVPPGGNPLEDEAKKKEEEKRLKQYFGLK